jgi:hypothetical protein
MRVGWGDTCLRIIGEFVAHVRTVASATVASCVAKTSDLQEYVSAATDRGVGIGDATVPFEVLSFEERYGPGSAVTDVVWPYGWSPDVPTATGNHGGTLPVRDEDGQMVIARVGVEYYDRAAWPANPPGTLVARFDGLGLPGGLSLPLPGQPGRFVAHIDAAWELPCATGTAMAIVSVDVR